MSICGSQYCVVKTAELFDLQLLYILEKHCFYSFVVFSLSSYMYVIMTFSTTVFTKKCLKVHCCKMNQMF